MKKPTKLFSILAIALAGQACGGSDGDGTGTSGAALCTRLVQKLTSCNLVEPTGGQCTDSSLSDATDECQARCFLKAKCQTLRAFLCDDIGSVDPNDTAIGCSLACIDAETKYECDDGSDDYRESDKCDGFPDCDDESDEKDCPTLECDDGTTYEMRDECDGFSDCEDGTDEENCESARSDVPVKAVCGND